MRTINLKKKTLQIMSNDWKYKWKYFLLFLVSAISCKALPFDKYYGFVCGNMLYLHIGRNSNSHALQYLLHNIVQSFYKKFFENFSILCCVSFEIWNENVLFSHFLFKGLLRLHYFKNVWLAVIGNFNPDSEIFSLFAVQNAQKTSDSAKFTTIIKFDCMWKKFGWKLFGTMNEMCHNHFIGAILI